MLGFWLWFGLWLWLGLWLGSEKSVRVLIFPPEPSKECVKVSHVIFECRVINHHPHGTWFIEHGSLYMVHCTWFMVHGSLYMVHCTMYMVNCTWFMAHSSFKN